MAITNGLPTTSAISFSKPAKPKPPPVYYVNNKKVTKKPIGAANSAVFVSRMAKLNAIRKKREDELAKTKRAAKKALEEEKKLFLASNVAPPVTKGDMFFVAKTKKKKSLVFVLSQPEPTKTGCIISSSANKDFYKIRKRFNNYYIPPKGSFNWKMKVLILGGKRPQIKVKVFTTETLLNIEIAGTKTTSCPHCNGVGKIRTKTNSVPLNDIKDKSESELIAEILKMAGENKAILPDEAAPVIATESTESQE